MFKLIGRRLLLTIPVLFIVTLFTSLLAWLMPGDPAIAILGEQATAESVAEVRDRLGLDRNPIEQYLAWITALFQGDLGNSFFTRQPVFESLLSRLPVTISLTLVALLFATIIGGIGALISARFRDTMVDRVSVSTASIALSIPNYWLSTLLVLAFAIQLSWFPATGYVPLSVDPAGWLRSLFLPALALSLPAAGEILRQLRASMRRVQEEDYMRTAFAYGLPPAAITMKYGLKNAAGPAVTVIGFQAAAMLGGAVLIEKIFALPGLGSFAVDAVVLSDIPVIQGVVLVTVLVVSLVNLLVDIAYGWVNPRVRAA